MASNKRRKLNNGSESPNISAISAFAARRQHQLTIEESVTSDNSCQTKSQKINAASQDIGLYAGGSFAGVNRSIRLLKVRVEQKPRTEVFLAEDDNFSDSSPYEEDDEEEDEVGKTSRVVDNVPPRPLTTVMASKSKLMLQSNGDFIVKISPGEKVVALGEYGLSVVRGQITVMGAVLNASDTVHHVYALSSHSLPVIRYLSSDTEVAEIRLIQYNSGLRSLKYLSPLFGRLWNESATMLGSEGDNARRSSFQILFSTNDGSRKMLVQPIQSPPEWNETFATFCSGKWTTGNRSVAMICGPKSSGKSTYTKLLINRLLTNQTPLGQQFPGKGRKQRNDGVLLLDLDPGQPEYAPTGQLSLVHLSRPNFGPPYSHPDPKDEGLKIIRSHSICAISPSNDTGYYTTCVLDLLTHYRKFITSHPDCPLIINTPGWVQGTGLELLTDLIKQARPTVIIYTSIEGPADVVKTLQEEAKKNRLITLPSQATEYITRTAAQLRIMQAMSYFHSGPLKRNSPSWSANPLTSTPPWQVKYSGKNAGILGILCMGEQPLGDLIKDTINGAVLAVVVIDDMAAFPGLSGGTSGTDVGFDTANPRSESSHISSIHRTKEENLPYLNATNASTLDPRYSHSIGLALVRGIDVENQIIQILTPIPSHILKDVQQCGKRIVLVSGRLETPGWAYIEELYKRAAAKKRSDEDIGDEDSIDNIDGESSGLQENVDAFEDTPWIEKLAGHEGRGAAARVWKVRRDLGRPAG